MHSSSYTEGRSRIALLPAVEGDLGPAQLHGGDDHLHDGRSRGPGTAASVQRSYGRAPSFLSQVEETILPDIYQISIGRWTFMNGFL